MLLCSKDESLEVKYIIEFLLELIQTHSECREESTVLIDLRQLPIKAYGLLL